MSGEPEHTRANQTSHPARSEAACSRCGYPLDGLPTPAVCPECGTPKESSRTQLTHGVRVLWRCFIWATLSASLSGVCGLWMLPGRRGTWDVRDAASESFLIHSALLLLAVFVGGIIWMACAKPSNRPRALYPLAWGALITILLAAVLMPVQAS